MLSPASHRVCCLAVMAPALTKADRRTDRLPVVLSDPFCIPREDKGSDLLIAHKPPTSRFPSLLVKRKPSMQKVWLKTITLKNPSEQRPPSKLKLLAPGGGKSWHGGNATIAVADKVRLKYIMNKNNGSLHRNMGLARANTTIGLHSIPKANNIYGRDKNSPSSLAQESGESSPDLPDSNKTELETVFPILRLVQPDSPENNLTSPPDVCKCPQLKSDSGAVDDLAPQVLNSEKVQNHNSNSPRTTDHVTIVSPCEISVTEPHSSFEVKCDDGENSPLILDSDLNNDIQVSPSESNQNDDAQLSPFDNNQNSDSHLIFNLLSKSISPVTEPSSNCPELTEPELEPVNFESPLSPLPESDIDDVETASAHLSYSSSSTLSADDASPLSSPTHEFEDSVLVTFPDSFLSSGEAIKSPTEIEAPGHLNSQQHLDNSDLEDDLPSTDQCCPLTKRDLTSLRKSFRDLESRMVQQLSDCEDLMNRCMIGHVRRELKTLVLSLSRKLPIHHHPSSSPALVNLVRHLHEDYLRSKLESTVDVESAPAFPPCVTEKEFVDLQTTSDGMLDSMKRLLKSSDPYLTESSDEDRDSEFDAEEEPRDSLQKRSLQRFMRTRASLASRSTYVVARIHELENQVRTINGMHKKLAAFEEVHLEHPASNDSASDSSKSRSLVGPVNGYLERSEESELKRLKSESRELCSRTRALQTSSFTKRKVLVTNGLHTTSSKLAKPSSFGCFCNSLENTMPCMVCTGRYNSKRAIDPDSLPLLERVALLDPTYHPVLSFDKDIPLGVHFEKVFRRTEEQYQVFQAPSPVNNHRRFREEQSSFFDARSRSRKYSRYSRSFLSAKYRNKKHFRKKHKLVFGKWKKFHNKGALHNRDRPFRRFSVASSGSSHDSPIPSPMLWEDGYDLRKRRDDNQLDIDDVIIPYSSKRGRIVKFEFKDIEIPSWRPKPYENLESIEPEEDIADSAFVSRHDTYEVIERKTLRNGGNAQSFFNTWQKRTQRRIDSRLSSSGANTPDPVVLPPTGEESSEFVFVDPQSPLSPPPVVAKESVPSASEDSQGAVTRQKNNSGGAKRPEDIPGTSAENTTPYESRIFPLPDDLLQQLIDESEQFYNQPNLELEAAAEVEEPMSVSRPVSPSGSTSTATSMEDEEDVNDNDDMDPEWTIVKKESSADLVLKFAKR